MNWYRACRVAAAMALAVSLTAGCATSSQSKQVSVTGSGARVPEGPVLSQKQVESRCPDEPFACALGGLMLLQESGETGDSTTEQSEREKQAAELLSPACEAELPIACATLASMYVVAEGVERDLERAQELYRRACDEFGAFGCTGLARMYETGASVSKSAKKSGKLYRKACELGGGEGCYRLWEWRRSFGTPTGAFTAAARGCAYANDESCDALEEQYGIPVDEEAGRARLVSKLEAACEAAHLSACELLGRHYESGDTAVRDTERASQLYSMACMGGETGPVARACDRLGALYESGSGVSKDVNRAAGLFEKSCSEGWSVACSHLASMHERGVGATKDEKEAMRLYREACARGHARACYKVGSLVEGESSGEDATVAGDRLVRAAVFYQIGCSSGSAGACNALGVVAEESDAFEVSSGQVVRLYQRACQLGSANGCYNLGVAFQTGAGIERSASEALKYFRRACDRGMAEGCQHIGLPEDDASEAATFEKALRTVMLLENACEDGAARACTRAGIFHREGRGGLEKDSSVAVDWFQKGCKRGDPGGCSQYAYHLQEGLGVERNVSAAAKQFAVACEGGSASACTYLGALYASGDVDVSEAHRRAAELFKAACDEDEYRACVRLGRMIRGSWEVPIEVPTAKALFERACEGGHEGACAELEALETSDNAKDGAAGKGTLNTDKPPEASGD